MKITKRLLKITVESLNETVGEELGLSFSLDCAYGGYMLCADRLDGSMSYMAIQSIHQDALDTYNFIQAYKAGALAMLKATRRGDAL